MPLPINPNPFQTPTKASTTSPLPTINRTHQVALLSLPNLITAGYWSIKTATLTTTIYLIANQFKVMTLAAGLICFAVAAVIATLSTYFQPKKPTTPPPSSGNTHSPTSSKNQPAPQSSQPEATDQQLPPTAPPPASSIKPAQIAPQSSQPAVAPQVPAQHRLPETLLGAIRNHPRLTSAAPAPASFIKPDQTQIAPQSSQAGVAPQVPAQHRLPETLLGSIKNHRRSTSAAPTPASSIKPAQAQIAGQGAPSEGVTTRSRRSASTTSAQAPAQPNLLETLKAQKASLKPGSARPSAASIMPPTPPMPESAATLIPPPTRDQVSPLPPPVPESAASSTLSLLTQRLAELPPSPPSALLPAGVLSSARLSHPIAPQDPTGPAPLPSVADHDPELTSILGSTKPAGGASSTAPTPRFRGRGGQDYGRESSASSFISPLGVSQPGRGSTLDASPGLLTDSVPGRAPDPWATRTAHKLPQAKPGTQPPASGAGGYDHESLSDFPSRHNGRRGGRGYRGRK